MSSTDAKKDATPANLRGDFLAGLLDSTNLVVYLKDIEGRYIYVNRRYERLSTFPRAALLGKRDHDFFAPAVADLFRAQDAQVIAHRGPLEFEETIPLPGGELSFITEKFPLFDAKGQVCAVGGFCTEITTQKDRADETLAEQRERLAVTMRAISDSVISTDTGGVVTMINAAAEVLTGLSQGEAAGRAIDAALPAADRRAKGAFGRLVSQVLATGQGPAGPAVDIDIAAPGGVRTVLPSAGVVRDRRGNVIGAVLCLRDVTQRRALEAESRRLARSIVKAREEEKKRFSDCLQHSMNTLQSEMSSLLMAAEADVRAGAQRESLEKLERARRLLRDSVSSVRNASVEYWPESLALPGLAPALGELLSRFCKRSSVRVLSTIQLPDKAPAPESQLSELLYRLAQEALSNIEKHSLAQKVEFSLKSRGSRLILSVRDDGCGFDAAAGRRGRPGLGLKMLTEEIRAAGGKFSLVSRPGRGTLLRAELPFSPEK